MGLGASVKVFDNSVHRLIRSKTPWVNALDVNAATLGLKSLRTADVAIGAFGVRIARPMLVSEPMVAGMRDRSIVVDVSIDRGGVFETSRLTSHERPTFIECGVIHYCVPNIPSRVARTASKALSNIFAPMLLGIAGEGGVVPAIKDRNLIATGVYMFNGTLTHEEISSQRSMPWKPLICWRPRSKRASLVRPLRLERLSSLARQGGLDFVKLHERLNRGEVVDVHLHDSVSMASKRGRPAGRNF